MQHYFTNNDNLKSEFKSLYYNYKDYKITLTSDLGVFSKNKLDYGSRLLLETYLENNTDSKKILDLGCGYGFIGLSLAKITNSAVTLSDINNRCIHLTELNIKNNNLNSKVIKSDIYENINETFDIIITNPPIRIGKESVMKILIDAEKHLNKNGELWCVIRKDQGAKSYIKHLEEIYEVEVIKKDKGFFIIKNIKK